MGPTIAFLNESTVVSDDEVWTIVAALQVQVSRDYAPTWGMDAALVFVPKGQPLPAGAWAVVILDDADQADSLGYHELGPGGFPLGKVFARTVAADGGSVSVTASHELLEMLGDPYVELMAYAPEPDGSVTIRAYENCDAVESDDLGYRIAVGDKEVLVSDFVLPQWFNYAATEGTQFDFRGHCSGPLQLKPGGYIGEFDPRPGHGWTQLTADAGVHHSRAHRYRGGRWSKRTLPRAARRRSTAFALLADAAGTA